MKFSTIVTTLLAVTPLTQASLFNSIRSAPKEEETIKTSKAQIVIQGVPQDFSKQDLAVINQSAISAYNALQQDSKYSLVTLKPLLHFGTGDSESVSQCMLCPPDDDQAYPTDDFWTTHANEKVLVADVQVSSKQCMLCPPDDDQAYPTDDFWATTVSNHKLFVESFCNLLATSGSKNLAKAHHCSFSFLEKPGHDVAPIALVNQDKTAGSLGFLSVTGLLHKLTADDIDIVQSSTLETFNEVFAKTAGYSQLKSLKVLSTVETPKTHKGLNQCMLCPPDDDQAYPTDDFWNKQSVSADLSGSVLLLDVEFAAPKTHNKGLSQCMLCPPDDDQAYPTDDFWAVGVKQCMLCPPDDDQAYPTDDFWAKAKAAVSTKKPSDVSAKKESKPDFAMAFTKALCSKLRNSGSPNLVFAGDCALDFFYEHATPKKGEKKESA